MISRTFRVLILSKFQRLSVKRTLLDINLKCVTSNSCSLIMFSSLSKQNAGLSCLGQNLFEPRKYIQEKRTKYTKKNSKGPEYDSDSEEDNEDFKDEAGSKVINIKINSLRADLILKSGLGLARNKVEQAFYENNIRVNGKKISKKSIRLHIGDEIDLIKGVSQMNSDFLNISRLVILSVNERDDDEDGLAVKLRKFKTMYIEDYEEHPWKQNVDS